MRHLRELGNASLRVWVLQGNPGEEFYRRLGGRRVSEKALTMANAAFTEIAYGWSDLSRFGEIAQP